MKIINTIMNLFKSKTPMIETIEDKRISPWLYDSPIEIFKRNNIWYCQRIFGCLEHSNIVSENTAFTQAILEVEQLGYDCISVVKVIPFKNYNKWVKILPKYHFENEDNSYYDHPIESYYVKLEIEKQ